MNTTQLAADQCELCPLKTGPGLALGFHTLYNKKDPTKFVEPPSRGWIWGAPLGRLVVGSGIWTSIRGFLHAVGTASRASGL